MYNIIRIYLVLAWTFFILKLTSCPMLEAQYYTEGMTDKFVHLFLFGVFVFLIAYNFNHKKIKITVLVIALVVSILFSVFIEYFQDFIPGRNRSIYDFIAGISGAIGVCAILYYLKNRLPKLLLHICCVGCGTYVSKVLKKDFRVSLYFYNPSIYPQKEHELRLSEAKKVAKKLNIKLHITKYDHASWLKVIKGHEKDKERGERCTLCYEDRLKSTVKFAKANRYDYFTSTLTVSPHKDAKRIINFGKALKNKYKIKFLDKDFKKKDGFKKASKLSKNLNLYRQNYCGCEFSVNKNTKIK